MITLYAWLAKQPDGEERLCGLVHGGLAMPAITVVKRIAYNMKPTIEAQALADGVTVRLAIFDERAT